MTRSVVIIGAGISGLAAARHLDMSDADIDITILEASSRAGGMIETEHCDGLTIDHGPEGIVTTKPEALDLIDEVGLTDEIVVDGPAPRQTFIVRGGELRPLPYGILNPTRTAAKNLLRTGLLSPIGKARLALEPLIPHRVAEVDESVAAFVKRRFGGQLLDALVSPLVGGIHGADTDDLSAELVLPALVALDRRKRSIALAALRNKPSPRAYPPLVTLERGMASLIDRLVEPLGDRIRFETEVTAVERTADGWLVRTDTGDVIADAIIVAVPSKAAARLLAPHDPDLGSRLAEMPTSTSQTVTFIWDSDEVDIASTGTGFIVPADEGHQLAACTWTTSKWHHRSSGESVMVRCFVRAPNATDEELAAIARAELADLMGLSAEPTRTIVRRVDDALPVMRVGHRAATAAIHERAAALGTVAVAGAGLEGSGLPACIRSGHRAAVAVIRSLLRVPA